MIASPLTFIEFVCYNCVNFLDHLLLTLIESLCRLWYDDINVSIAPDLHLIIVIDKNHGRLNLEITKFFMKNLETFETHIVKGQSIAKFQSLNF